MLNFGASKPRVRGGARAPGAPPLDPHLYFVTKDAFDDSESIVIETTTASPTTTPMITTTSTPTEAPVPDGVRLNKTVIPMHYNVELQPYLYEGDDFSFNGSVIMWLR